MHSDWIAEALGTRLDRAQPEPLARQIERQLRTWVRDGKLAGGSALPASRALAGRLKLGRNTVLAAYDQLIAEGYLETRHGSGTYVTPLFGQRVPTAAQRPQPLGLSQRGAQLAECSRLPVGLAGAFAPGAPELAQFPHAPWQRLLARHQREAPQAWLNYCVEGGLPALREALSGYLQLARGVRCHPDQILITQGAQQALELCARLLADPGDVAWMEEPGYVGAQAAMRAASLDLVPVPVDEQGLAPALAPDPRPPRLVYVTPSHQYPSGVVMTLARRLELLARADAANAWILEDDYDSEFRYTAQPPAALQGLAKSERVIYVGTFSKVMYPGLRVGYLVVPDGLIDAFRAAYARLYREGQYPLQAALADFLSEGHFTRHVRRMRELYQQRQQLLRSTLSGRLGAALPPPPGEAGMHLVASLPPRVDEHALANQAAAEHIWLRSLQRHYLGPPTQRGLVLGYAGVEDSDILRAGTRLAQLLETQL
ncbi:MAG: PLP-dependent aminotransferase family protein [Pseudogulbenkiania sp.]|nr:PLP-dependent aminotransferase family protein [Pseudogulbenkiania sp.]